jgi:hypothetical protein
LTFYCLHKGDGPETRLRVQLLRTACQARALEFVNLDSNVIDYSKIVVPGQRDFLYNSGRGSQILESLMLGGRATTFYHAVPKLNLNLVDTTTLWGILLEREGLPAPRTVYEITKDRQLLDKYVERLGGYPVVLKAHGGTRGVGVIKIESSATLYSLIDHLADSGRGYMLRQYISPARVLRVVVLGSMAIATAEYMLPEGDFRSNVPDLPRVRPAIVSAEIEKTAIQAVAAIGVDCGGVDLIEDDEGRHYVLEVNFPFSFLGAQFATGRDIPGAMVDFLIEKQRSDGSATRD